jgi:hypothetical protein
MAEPHIVKTLRRKREEIESVIADLETRLALAKIDHAQVGRTLAIFDCDPREPMADYFEIGRLWRRSEIVALCRAALAECGPLDTNELTDRVIAAKGLQNVGAIMLQAIRGRVGRALANAKIRGLVESEGERHERRWSLRR